ncbi:hypothetical protein [Hwanghaeella sp.]|uniref:hypothetical protein n=1 Tax=Hwanghaeella sp. TaxID=2605943 RepID=UPI003CCBB626
MTDGILHSRYDRRMLLADFARSAAGLFFTLGPALFLNPIPILFWIFLAAGMLFLAFGVKTVQKWMTRVEMTAETLTVTSPITASLTWKGLQSAKLRFYATRRKSRKGWMQLTLKDGHSRIVLDSALEDFDTVAKYAARWILEKRIDLDIPSRENFLALGIRLDRNTESENQ